MVCSRRTGKQRAAGERETRWTRRRMAGMLQLLAWLGVAICLLPGVAGTQSQAGWPTDSDSMGGGLQEPAAPEVMFEHRVPNDLEGAEQRLQQLQRLHKRPPLSPWEFEQLLLTGLSCIYRLHATGEAEERGRWALVFALLAQETLWDLCKGFCPQDQPPSLGPWALILDPFP
ncbi:protein FAM180B isoform 2-T2 [Dugong dugon]